MTDHRALIMWTIYDHPLDYPAAFVARKFVLEGPTAKVTGEVIVADSLRPIREVMLNRGLVCMARDERDDPKIIETWL